MNGYFVKPIGSNRGKPRIWLEKLEITTAGMKPGDRYDVHMSGGTVVLKANPDGSRVVSRKETKSGEYPVIDLESKALLALFENMPAIRLVQRDGEIHLLPLATELRKRERLTRLKDKVLSDKPLDMGGTSYGAGLLAHALDEGLKESGLATHQRFANEIRPELLQHASTFQTSWSEKTMVVAAPMQEFAFDEAARKHMPRTEVWEAGLPCSGASSSGRARRKTSKAEEHPEVGHLVVPALVMIAKANPAVIVFENVIPYASSASADILRHHMRDWGYTTHENILRGEDFNCLEHRDRWFMVAVTEGMHFDWSMMQLPEKQTMTLSDVLDPIADDDPMWSEMAGLKAKEVRDKAAGKGFMMQTFSAESDKISTITKGYAKVRSTDPKIKHPSSPNLLRQLTKDEHAKIKQFDPSIVRDLSTTLAHEILGQAVLHEPPKRLGIALGQTILNFAYDKKVQTVDALVNAMTDSLEETARMIVADLSAPLAGVKYHGPVTVNENGMVIQDIGNGVGILHRADALENVKLGEVLSVQYPRVTAAPIVEHLSRPAPAQTPAVEKAIKEQHAQQTMFDETPSARQEPIAPTTPVPVHVESIYKRPVSIYQGPGM